MQKRKREKSVTQADEESLNIDWLGKPQLFVQEITKLMVGQKDHEWSRREGLSPAYSTWWKDYTDPSQTVTSGIRSPGTLTSITWRRIDRGDKHCTCAWDFGNGGYVSSVCVIFSYLLLVLILSPGSLAVLLAQGFLLLVVQQGVVLMVTHNLVLIVLQHLSQNGILHLGKRWEGSRWVYSHH